MSAVAIGRRTSETGRGGPSMGRLTAVELRKMVDTRSGLWLMLAMALLALVAASLRATLGDAGDQTLENMFLLAGAPVGILLPVVGILAVTSEWSQRTALTTFALVPLRGRVALAKTLAGLAIGVAAVAACLVLAVIPALITGASGGLSAQLIGYSVIAQALSVLGGTAFGMLFLNSPVAIVASFALPTAWGVLASLVGALNDAGRWFDTSRTFEPLTASGALSGVEWERLVASAAVWILLPLAVGAWRLMRKEVA